MNNHQEAGSLIRCLLSLPMSRKPVPNQNTAGGGWLCATDFCCNRIFTADLTKPKVNDNKQHINNAK